MFFEETKKKYEHFYVFAYFYYSKIPNKNQFLFVLLPYLRFLWFVPGVEFSLEVLEGARLPLLQPSHRNAPCAGLKPVLYHEIRVKNTFKALYPGYTVCPRSSDPIYIVTYYIKRVFLNTH